MMFKSRTVLYRFCTLFCKCGIFETICENCGKRPSVLSTKVHKVRSIFLNAWRLGWDKFVYQDFS
jgi:hypothetical protein